MFPVSTHNLADVALLSVCVDVMLVYSQGCFGLAHGWQLDVRQCSGLFNLLVCATDAVRSLQQLSPLVFGFLWTVDELGSSLSSTVFSREFGSLVVRKL